MKTQIRLFPTLLAFFCLSSAAPIAQAVNPPPDGGYPGFNTAEGQNALFSLTTGVGNTAVGWFSLKSVTAGSFNTAIGAGTLLINTADQNTATGAGALLTNFGGFNVANGAFALLNNSSGSFNTALGTDALFNNVIGASNTAVGFSALFTNNTGINNTALGANAGYDITGNNNIDIGYNVSGLPGESNTIRIGNAGATDTYIAGISGATAASGAAVFVASDGKLGTTTSSARYKDEIHAMGSASEVLYALEPVSFRYKQKIDPARTRQLGLVAEDVEKVSSDLIVRDKEGKPYTVRYDQVNAMLLNEFLKEHRKVQKLEATVADLAEKLQRIGAQIEMSHSAAQVAVGNW